MNKHILSGALGKAPEVRYTGDGMAVANFSVATDDYVKKENVTDWHNCVAFGKTAEFIEKHFQKGSGIVIEGKVKTRKWEDKEGNTRYTTETVVERAEFSKGGTGSENATKPASQVEDEAFDDSIPF